VCGTCTAGWNRLQTIAQFARNHSSTHEPQVEIAESSSASQTSGQCLIGLAVSQGSPAGPSRTEKRCKGGGRAGRPSLDTPATNWPSVSIRAHLTALIQPPAYHIRTHPCRRLSRVCGQGRRALDMGSRLHTTPLKGNRAPSRLETPASPPQTSFLGPEPTPCQTNRILAAAARVCRVSCVPRDPACLFSVQTLDLLLPPILRHLSQSPDTEEARRRSSALGETITSQHPIITSQPRRR